MEYLAHLFNRRLNLQRQLWVMRINFNLTEDMPNKLKNYTLQKELLTYLLQEVVEREIVRVGHFL